MSGKGTYNQLLKHITGFISLTTLCAHIITS